MKRVVSYLKLRSFNKKWRSRNTFNDTQVGTIFPPELVSVDYYSYGTLNVYSRGVSGEKLDIGRYVSIAENVKFLLGNNHVYTNFSTYPFKVKFMNSLAESYSNGPIIVEDDVWIGMDSMILSGVTLGRGSIVAARSVVTKNVPPYSIVGGNPAKIIKYRFDEDLINSLMSIDIKSIDKKFVLDNKSFFYENLNLEVIKRIKDNLG